jgi:hypothetical protein
LDHCGPKSNKRQQNLSALETVWGQGESVDHYSCGIIPWSLTPNFSLPVFQFILQEVDITLPENSAWYERYKFDIPVFHLNGQFLMMHRVNTSKLEKQLLKLAQDSRD